MGCDDGVQQHRILLLSYVWPDPALLRYFLALAGPWVWVGLVLKAQRSVRLLTRLDRASLALEEVTTSS
jgi:hypothetical protein